MCDRRIQPAAIPRRNRTPKSGAPALVDEANNGVAIDGGGHRLSEFHVAEPFLFSRETRRRLFAEVVQVEEEKVIFEAGASVGHGVRALLASEYREIFCAKAGDQVCLARLKAQNLRVCAWDEEKNKLVEIR